MAQRGRTHLLLSEAILRAKLGLLFGSAGGTSWINKPQWDLLQGRTLPEHTQGCEILKVDAVSWLPATNGSRTAMQPPGRPFFFSVIYSFTRLTGSHFLSSLLRSHPLKSCQKVPTVSRVSAPMEVLISTRWDLTKAVDFCEQAALTRLKIQVVYSCLVQAPTKPKSCDSRLDTYALIKRGGRLSWGAETGWSCHSWGVKLPAAESAFLPLWSRLSDICSTIYKKSDTIWTHLSDSHQS